MRIVSLSLHFECVVEMPKLDYWRSKALQSTRTGEEETKGCAVPWRQ